MLRHYVTKLFRSGLSLDLGLHPVNPAYLIYVTTF
jgi:hypothetical protein